MKLFAGSLDAHPGFLHAGYLSAYSDKGVSQVAQQPPREPYYGYYKPVAILNMNTELALQDTRGAKGNAANAAPQAGSGRHAIPPPGFWAAASWACLA